MGKGSKIDSKSASHKLFKDKAKNRVDDLQGMFSDLQFARKESRAIDVAVLEEQVHQMLREWKAELNEPSPASSINGGSLGSFSSEIARMLQQCEEEDDAISPLKDVAAAPKPDPESIEVLQVSNGVGFQEGNSLGSFSDICRLLQLCEEKDDAMSPLKDFTAAPKADPGPEVLQANDSVVFQQDYIISQIPHDSFKFVDECGGASSRIHNLADDKLEGATQFDVSQDFGHSFFSGFTDGSLSAEDTMPDNSCILPNISPPPAAFLGPKCSLWDCPRPAQGSGWFHDYCSSFHSTLATNESPPGMTPVLRPGGIGLKDGVLFAALSAKVEGKVVGIPECEGAATAKSPWNAPELFDISVLEGETIREWLFFDKPRRAFESGNRKQRSLPDYSGRGWHESRKQVVNEFGGLKRSYYMDPQPVPNLEWHLFEYEINKCVACALYRLELKLVEGKKSSRGKVTNDSVADLQKQLGRLSAQSHSDNKRTVKGRTKVNSKGDTGNASSSPQDQAAPTNSNAVNYGVGAEYDHLVKNLNDHYLT